MPESEGEPLFVMSSHEASPIEEMPRRPSATAGRWGSTSEASLILALAETGDLIDSYLALELEDEDVCNLLAEACEDLAQIEDELMRRGFSPRLFVT